MKSTPPYLLKIHFNIILQSAPLLPSVVFPSIFPIKTLHAPFISPMRAIWPAHLDLPDWMTTEHLNGFLPMNDDCPIIEIFGHILC